MEKWLRIIYVLHQTDVSTLYPRQYQWKSGIILPEGQRRYKTNFFSTLNVYNAIVYYIKHYNYFVT